MLSRVVEQASGFVAAYRGPMLSLLTLLIFVVAYFLITKALRRYLLHRAEKPENVQNFLLVWRYLWMGLALVFVLVSFSGSLTSLGISAAFVGMIMGWSLQAPVTGIAAWLMILLKRPFKIGDRIIIAGIIGDVSDITLTHVHLNQVGGTVSGEERSGRGVLIPNATLFQQIIHNYTLEATYILDEVPVLITYESDFDEAERILLDAARQVTRDIINETGQEPFIRAELADSGIRIRLRYNTLGTDRQRVSSDIVRIVISRFSQSDKVEFCYPHTEVLHRPKQPKEAPGPA